MNVEGVQLSPGVVRCAICLRTFSKTFNLRRHVSLTHPEADPAAAMWKSTSDRLQQTIQQLEKTVQWLQAKLLTATIERDLVWECYDELRSS